MVVEFVLEKYYSCVNATHFPAAGNIKWRATSLRGLLIALTLDCSSGAGLAMSAIPAAAGAAVSSVTWVFVHRNDRQADIFIEQRGTTTKAPIRPVYIRFDLLAGQTPGRIMISAELNCPAKTYRIRDLLNMRDGMITDSLQLSRKPGWILWANSPDFSKIGSVVCA